jgi:hypothetical protein
VLVDAEVEVLVEVLLDGPVLLLEVLEVLEDEPAVVVLVLVVARVVVGAEARSAGPPREEASNAESFTVGVDCHTLGSTFLPS